MAEQKQERVKIWDETPGFDFIDEVDIPREAYLVP